MLSIFKDHPQQSTVMFKWINARATLSRMQDQPAYSQAHSIWIAACRVIDLVKDDYSKTCRFLDKLTKSMQKCEREVTGGSMPMKRKNADPAPAARTLPQHQESAPHQNHGPCPNALSPDIESAAASMSMPISSLDANSSGLMLARTTKRTTTAVRLRRVQYIEHLLKQASDGQPLSVRTLNKSFRKAVGVSAEELAAGKLSSLLKEICNHASGVEYLVLK